MLVAIISDTHLPRGMRSVPDQALERIRNADLLLHAGDISTLDVLEDLRALGPPVIAVHGNVDDRQVCEALPGRVEFDLDGVPVAMLHDAGQAQGRLNRLRADFPSAVAVVFGHSHIPLHERSEGFQIFNPGSPTDPRRQPRPTMGIARVAQGRISFEHVEL
jgi:hypothetical protein